MPVRSEVCGDSLIVIPLI